MRLRFEQLAHQAAAEVSRRMRQSNAIRLFGFELLAIEPGRAVMRLRIRQRHHQIHGVVHGGVIAALADTAGAMACYLALPRGTRLATVEMKINFLEAVSAGAVQAEGKMLRKGNTFTVSECEIRDAKNLLVSKSLLTYAIVKPKRK